MANLTAAERVALARHPQRPNITDYINSLFTDFFEQRGDRSCGEDAAILGGVAFFHDQPVTVIGTRKGRTLEENLACNFGMPGPEGYRKARLRPAQNGPDRSGGHRRGHHRGEQMRGGCDGQPLPYGQHERRCGGKTDAGH